MNRKIVVNVTQEDIRKGIACKCERCPIALALKRATHRKAWAGPELLGVTRNGKQYYYHATHETDAFIRNFDSGKIVSPFTFSTTRQDDK